MPPRKSTSRGKKTAKSGGKKAAAKKATAKKAAAKKGAAGKSAGKRRAASDRLFTRGAQGARAVLSALPTVSVTITSSVSDGGQLSATLNGVGLGFGGGEAHAVVPAGQDNELEWRVVGAAGTVWSIGVTKPANTGCSNSGTLDGAGLAAGQCVFGT